MSTPPPPAQTVTLLPFWKDNAAIWFAYAELRFRAKGVYDKWDRFNFVVLSLSKEVIQLCFATVTNPDAEEPYSRLKENLLQQHSLTKYQRIGAT